MEKGIRIYSKINNEFTKPTLKPIELMPNTSTRFPIKKAIKVNLSHLYLNSSLFDNCNIIINGNSFLFTKFRHKNVLSVLGNEIAVISIDSEAGVMINQEIDIFLDIPKEQLGLYKGIPLSLYYTKIGIFDE